MLWKWQLVQFNTATNKAVLISMYNVCLINERKCNILLFNTIYSARDYCALAQLQRVARGPLGGPVPSASFDAQAIFSNINPQS